MPAEIRIITAAEDPPWFSHRTRRSLPAAPSSGLWLIRAGAWLPRRRQELVPHAPEHPCVLIGCTLEPPQPQKDWRDLLHLNGGLFRLGDILPTIRSLWLNAAAACECGAMADLNTIATHALQHGWPVIRHGPLDVCFDTRLRALQILTSLQRGGAERLALDLHATLQHHRIATTLLTLGSPGREPFDTPCDTIQLRLPPNPAIRAVEIDEALRNSGSDTAHAHLVDGETLAQLQSDLPLAITIHNQRQGWPDGISRLQAKPHSLLIGCSQVVAHEIRDEFPCHASRTVWNGIRAPLPLPQQAHYTLTLICIANPRPQKRLPLLIDILAALPGAKLKIAGQPSAIHADALAEVRLCEEKIAAYGLAHAVEWLGTVQDVPALLAECDVLVATSLHEGMSLAQLEALASGVPVVATHVSGTDELVAHHPGMMTLLPIDATPAEFAAAIRDIATRRGQGTLAADFTSQTMAARHAWLHHAMLIPRDAPRGGLLLITNNFSTGGAQSSARRLLAQLRDMGESVSAVVLQEQIDHPTPGRVALEASGISVLALQPPEECEAQSALIPLLHRIAKAPPQAVLFWNVIPEYKILLADALWGFRVFDVSPGEMYFASLDRYFASPRPGLPYVNPADYGSLLTAAIVKHASEVEQARSVLSCPAHLIANGVPICPFIPESVASLWTLGTAARIHPHKRLEDLISAFRLVHAKHPQARLRIAGAADSGQEDYAATLQQSTQDLPIEWCGEIQDLTAFHHSLCLFAMISEPIGCPNASLEAMASSLPIVATAVGGAREQITHGITGLLTPARDATALAEAIFTLLKDPTKRAQMRAAAHARAHAHFSLETMATSYRRLCLEH